ncbi:DUF11 domain-containing protein [Pimelobacter simplex]|uniref:DUF11 domain-containing protein n=1 Tax=Nocardioides simplex TaxID=2045 RepID=UPI00214F7BDA|nr:DUF11 domain-containing protein [Pimelobacter simplex]UUW87118.1 DUF11 domain-containing protein [Pimelobacter simplex]UUW96624.1 DUF11 domain-containing protein [Pimelobacter simplex]
MSMSGVLVLRRLLLLLTCLPLLLAGLVALSVTSAPRAVAAPALDCSQVYGLQIPHPYTIWRVDTMTGTQTSVGRMNWSNQTYAFNAMGISGDGGAIYSVLATTNPNDGDQRYVATYTRATDTYRLTRVANALAYSHGAFNAATGIYYYGGVDSSNVMSIYGYNPATNADLGLVARGPVPVGRNGDMAFDAQGNLYLSTGDTNGNNAVSVIKQDLPTARVGRPLALQATELARVQTTAGQPLVGLAFAGTGYLHVASRATIFQINPTTGAVVHSAPMVDANRLGDLASCAAPNTVEVAKDFPSGRKDPGDQVTLSVTGGGITRANTATTAGSADGVQPQVAGPVLALTGTRYTITETGAGTGLPDYRSRWTCVDQNAGDVVIASGTGTTGSFVMPDGGTDGVAALCTFANDAIRPALTIDKTADRTDLVAGETITYSFEVTNTGNAPLRDITVDETSFDGAGDLSTVTCPAGELAPTESTTCTATYVVQQADVDRGRITNAATASGTPTTGGDPVTSPPDEISVPQEPIPTLRLVKTADRAEAQRAGQTISYSFLVTNTGNVTLHSVRIDETAFNGSGTMSAVTCPAGPLAPRASVTCTATYRLTQTDVDAGEPLVNTATAAATTPGGEPAVSGESSATVRVPADPELDLEKIDRIDLGPDGVPTAGDVITYTFRVTNRGNVTVDQVAIDEQEFTGTGALSPIDCPSTGPLAPGEQLSCTATYALTQADIDAGQVDNTAVATGTDPSGDPVTSPPSTTGEPIENAPRLELVKTALPVAASRAGEVVSYQFKITNTGNVTVHDVGVDEQAFSGLGARPDVYCPPAAASLRPGASVTCFVRYTLTQADVDRGQDLTNTARASAADPHGDPVQSPPSEAVVDLADEPSITLVKSADTRSLAPVGKTVRYSFIVTNTGNLTLREIDVTEGTFTGAGPMSAISCPPVEALAPDASITCTATYVVQQADVDRGTLDNSATAGGTPPHGPPVTSEPSRARLTEAPAPRLSIDKRADRQVVTRAGEVIAYSFVVTNTGNVSLREITVADTGHSGSGELSAVVCPAEPAVLIPGASTTCTATYAVTQADIDAQAPLTNAATAGGTPPQGDSITSLPDQVEVDVVQDPALTLTKSVSPDDTLRAGETLTYTFVVTNSGNTTLHDVDVTETQFTGAGRLSEITCPTSTLVPTEQMTCTASYVVEQADVDAGRVYNAANAWGRDPQGGEHGSGPAEAAVPQAPAPRLSLVKSADRDGITAAGQSITYTFALTNTGNVTIADWHVDEVSFDGSGTMGALTCRPAGGPPGEPGPRLAPGETVLCTATYVTTQADVDRGGRLTNTAVAGGTAPGGASVASDRDSVSVPVTPSSSIALTKSADKAELVAGETVTYSFVVANTGTVTLREIVVRDTSFSGSGALSAISCPVTTLAPGARTTCTATYEVTQDDVDAGTLDNRATAAATPPGVDEPVVSAPSQVTIPAGQAPALSLDKSVEPRRDIVAGTRLTYSFRVTNTGNVTLREVAVTEGDFSGTGALSAITCPARPLRPGDATTCTATYEVTQADVDAGSLTNTATAAATPPQGDRLTSAPDTEVLPLPPAPALSLVKSSDATDLRVGQVVTYAFAVTNTGTVTLTDVSVTEGAFSGSGALSPITCPPGALAPQAQITCVATYTVTQDDVDAGALTNTATAHGTPPTGDPIASPPSSATVQAPGTAALSLVKKADRTVLRAGETVTYSFEVTNTGTVRLREVAVTETAFSGSGTLSAITCPGTALAPGESMTCTATYEPTQADVDAGALTNTATAGATPPRGPAVSSPPARVDVPVTPAPSLSLVKRADTRTVGVGDRITYSFVVTNTGNVTLRRLEVREERFSGSGRLGTVRCPALGAGLAPGQRIVCTADYRVTAADVRAGGLHNVASAQAVADGTPTVIVSGPSAVDLPPAPASTPAHGGALPATGSPVGWPLLALGVLLTLLGGAAVLVGRRFC